MGLGLGILGLRQTRVRARARLRVLRWHGRHLAEVNENINLGYSQDQGSQEKKCQIQSLYSLYLHHVYNPCMYQYHHFTWSE